MKYEYDKRNNIFVGWYIPEGENKKVQYKIYKYIEPQFVIYDDSRYKRPCYDVNVKKMSFMAMLGDIGILWLMTQ